MTNYASIETRSAYLSSDFGENFARKLFGNEILDALPRYVRGKRKGKIKGRLTWRKCTRGGWVRTGPYGGYGDANGYVQAKGFINARIEELIWGKEPRTLHKMERPQREC